MTVACGLITVFALRGLGVRCFKCSLDFLDGIQHAAALNTGRQMRMRQKGGQRDGDSDSAQGFWHKASPYSMTMPQTANLEGWMQGGC